MLLRSATVRDLERLTARVFESPTRTTGCRLAAYRIDENFYLDIDLPGVDAASIDVTVDNKALTVRATRNPAAASNETDNPAGTFSRQVVLDDSLDTDRIEARHENGVLTLTIPVKTDSAQD